jgi:anti-sigma factor RsiW
MTCRELVDFIMDYLNGELPERERSEFEVHLAVCPPCVAYLASYRQTVTIARAASKPLGEEAVAEMPEELIQAILAARKKEEKS